MTGLLNQTEHMGHESRKGAELGTGIGIPLRKGIDICFA